MPWGRRTPVDNRETSVYQLCTAAGDLLYVGVAVEPFLRLDQHWKAKLWWPDVDHVHIEWFATRQDAMDEELRAIREENPVHNIQGRGGPLQCRPTPARREPIRPAQRHTWAGGHA